MKIKIFSFITCLMFLTGCANTNSILLSEVDNPGLTYYMPERDLVITVKVGDPTNDKKRQKIAELKTQIAMKETLKKKEKNTSKKKMLASEISQLDLKISALNNQLQTKHPEIISATVSVTEAYPDLSEGFVINFQSNPFGKSDTEIGVSERGLLNSSTSRNEPQFSLLLSNIGAASPAGFYAPLTLAECEGVGEYVFIRKFKDITAENLCGTSLSMAVSKYGTHNDGVSNSPTNHSVSGIFFRQNRPYKITLTAPGKFKKESIVFSPSGSPTFLLPIKRTLFAKGEAKFTLKHGIPTKFKQETDGELIALLKLPADLIGAYAKAAGGLFDSFAKSSKSEAAAEQAEVLLELAKQKNQACLDAISTSNSALVELLDCRKAD